MLKNKEECKEEEYIDPIMVSVLYLKDGSKWLFKGTLFVAEFTKTCFEVYDYAGEGRSYTFPVNLCWRKESYYEGESKEYVSLTAKFVPAHDATPSPEQE